MRTNPSGRSERPALSRHAIVTAARKLIALEGHEVLTLRRLSADLGVTAPALYAHFESKEDLLRAVAHAEFEWSVAKEASLRLADIPDPVERLREISVRFVDYVAENREIFRLLMIFPPEFFRRENFEATDPPTSLGGRVFRTRAEAIRDAIAQDRFREDDPFLVGLTLFTAVHGLATLLLMEPQLNLDFQRQLIESVIDTVLKGLAAPIVGTQGPPESKSTAASAVRSPRRAAGHREGRS